MKNWSGNVYEMFERRGVKAAVREEVVFKGERTGSMKVPSKLE